MIYEVRTYTLRPGTLAEFEERYAKRLPLREKHSKLGAFWHTEFGPLNQVIHVYPYDDLQHRTRVRTAMAQDAERNAMPGGGEFVVAQEAEIMSRLSAVAKSQPALAVVLPWLIVLIGDAERIETRADFAKEIACFLRQVIGEGRRVGVDALVAFILRIEDA